MALIKPFRGIRFNLDKVTHLTEVVTPPYDVIDEAGQDFFYRKHPNNIIRLEYGKVFPEDNESNNRYTRAASDFREWLEDEILIQEDQPAIYFYQQGYTVNSTKKTRSGIICLLKLEDYKNNIVLPHEETMPKHKADRLALMNATHANFSPIFGIYADKEEKISHILTQEIAESTGARKPDVDFTDEQGQEHRLWVITDQKILEAICQSMAGKKVYIADGHHRYETALKYRDERYHPKVEAADGQNGGLEAHDFMLVTLVNIFDPGLVILPTHRMVRDVPGLDMSNFLQSLEEDFQLRELPLKGKDDLNGLWEEMAGQKHTFGMYGSDGRLYLLTLKDSVDVATAMPSGKALSWQQLDVSVLHSLVLDQLLGLDAAQCASGQRLTYTREEAGALGAVDRGEYQLVFFLNPTSVEEVTQVAGDGEKMPQKSTFFYPKLITGMVVNRI